MGGSVMFSLKTEKIVFVKEYWGFLLNGNIDIFDKVYLTDLKTILIDISLSIEYINSNLNKQKNKDRITFGELPYICENFNIFIKKSYYKDTKIGYMLNKISEIIISNNCFREIIIKDKNNKREEKIIPKLKRILLELNNYIKNCISEINSSKSFYKILKKIELLCCNSVLLKYAIDEIKFLISEAIFAGYNEGMSRRFLENFFDNINININEDRFHNLINEPKSRKIIYIFKIKNLYQQRPVQIKNVIFYNPMRADLLEGETQEKLYDEDIKLMTLEKQELFKKYGINEGIINCTEQEYTDLLETDSHARIVVEALDTLEGVDRAKKKVEEILTILEYLALNNKVDIRIQETYATIDSITNEHNIWNETLNIKNKKQGCYCIRDFDEYLKREVRHNSSKLNMIQSLDNKEILMKSLFWFNDAENQTQLHMKYLCYFICIETILSKSKDSNKIKTRLIKIVPSIVIKDIFINELCIIYGYFVNRFSIYKACKGVPQEIQKIKGLENFCKEINLRSFANNIKLFKKYSKSPHINFLIEKYWEVYSDIKVRNKTIDELKQRIEYTLKCLYRLRNQLVHTGEINKYQMELNIEFLKYVSNAIIKLLVLDINPGDIDEDIVNKISENEITIKFNEWKNSFI